MSRTVKLLIKPSWGATVLCLLAWLVIFTAPTPPVSANRNLPTDLSYSTETTWLLPGLPDLSAASGYIPHNFSQGEAIFQLGGETIHGFRPGKVYPEMYIRDIAWGMETVQYYYPDEYLREPVEAYLRRQYTAETVSLDGDLGVVAGNGAIGGIITPQGRSNKQTITTDEETSLIHAAYLYYNMTYNTAWLQQPVKGLPVISRLNLAADWLYNRRLNAELQLFWRGHTTDWGDVKIEKGPGYTDYNPSRDHQTASIYDQALAYMTLLELAQMNAAVGDTKRADEWQAKAEALKVQTNTLLWQADKGFYLTHSHITPLEHSFDETIMVSISNALAVYAGLTDFRQNKAIFTSLEKARLAAGADKPGLSIYPFYPNKWPDLFFEYPGMGYGNYQNGGLWDWWGGVQIKAEFQQGFSEAARTHLLQVANDWREHPGNIIEWHSMTDPRHEGSHYYSAAAGTMGSAIIEGFFGVDLTGQGLTLQPRLGLNDGYIRVYQPTTDRYVAYSYDWDQAMSQLEYGTNAGGAITVKLLKLRSENIQGVAIDGQPVEFVNETVGLDTYLAFTAPSGRHTMTILKGQPAQPKPAEVLSSSEANSVDPAPDLPETANSISPIEPSQENNIPVSPLPVSPSEPPAESQIVTTETPAARIARENRVALFQCISVLLVLFTSLGLMVMALLRRLAALNQPKPIAYPRATPNAPPRTPRSPRRSTSP